MGYNPARGHRARYESRKQNRQAQDYTPTITVRRKVQFEDREGLRLRNRLRGQLINNIGSKKAAHFDFFTPDNLYLTVLEGSDLKNQLLQSGACPTPDQMKTLGRVTLMVLLKRVITGSRELALPLGQLDTFGEGKVKPVIGVTPLGWRGNRARYAANDPQRTPSPLGQLVAESQACVDAIQGTLGEPYAVDLDTLRYTPHLSLAENRRGIHRHEFRRIEPLMAAVLPSVVQLGAPEIIVDANPQKIDPVVYSLAQPLTQLARAA